MSQDINSFIPSSLIASKAKKGIFVHLTLLHCSGNVEGFKIFDFPLSEKGKQDLEIFMTTIDDVTKLMMEHHEKYPDFIAKKITEKHNVEYEEFYKLLKKFTISDGAYDDGYAEPYKYFVEFHDGTGQVVSTEVKNIESNF